MSEAMSQEYRDALNQSAQLLHQNRPGEALTALEPYMDRLPNDADLAINAGGAYILQRKWDKAVDVLSKAAKATPDNVMLWTNLAAAELGRLELAGPRRQDRAIEAYEKALAIDPRAHNVHYSLGLIYKERGELTRAAAFFQRALEVNPADRDAPYWLKQIDRILKEAGIAPMGKEDDKINDGEINDDDIEDDRAEDAE